jgi:O-acetyl-ADP-ribose deacetylase (regulator of RNase III)
MREILVEHQTKTGQIIRVVRGDLTEERVDAIVNAANEHLAHGGGVAGAIVRRGGYSIQEESNRWVREHGAVHTGTAAITGAGTLPCRHVIHAVGPVWRKRGDEPELLASAVRSALQLATEHGLSSVSMPGISSGIFGFPKPLCAEVMLATVSEFLVAHPEGSVREVNLCNIDPHTATIFAEEARRRFGEK